MVGDKDINDVVAEAHGAEIQAEIQADNKKKSGVIRSIADNLEKWNNTPDTPEKIEKIKEIIEKLRLFDVK